MNILLINDEFYMTGASAALYDLAMHLKGVGHAVSVMPRVDGDGVMRQRYIDAGIPITTSANGIDLVIANTISLGDNVAKFGAQFPIIWWLHEAEIGRAMILRTPAHADGFRRAAHIVFQTDFQKEVYHSFLYDTRTETSVIPFWSEAVYQKRPTRQKSKTGKRRIVAIGTIEPRKRISDVVMAVEMLHDKNLIECLFIGKDYNLLEPPILEIIRKNPNRYQLLGEQPAASTLEYLASADAFVLASDSESQPLSLFEAFELGIPVCLSSLETYRHVGIMHGIHGLMHPVGNVPMLAANLRTVLGDPIVRSNLAKGAKLLIDTKRKVDWKVSFERVIERVWNQRRAVTPVAAATEPEKARTSATA
ncbi:glycosyltransferase family 4 protein [Pararobbsia silviterrae]|uniref:glycosyltransferase family 4 protein n=1 Tax=Pararobbsia silviterrae TaxID=1792498 RepID=UPI001313DF64|nr:glycosyltransferase family 4 protein [Pararobbsia silviterrae]